MGWLGKIEGIRLGEFRDTIGHTKVDKDRYKCFMLKRLDFFSDKLNCSKKI